MITVIVIAHESLPVIYFVALSAMFLSARWWRRRAGFRLPPRVPGATTPSRLVRVYVPPFGGRQGSLTVAPGRVQVDTFMTGKRIGTQSSGPVVALRSRFWLLSFRQGFILRGDTWWLGISASPTTARYIRKELTAAGFEIEDRPIRFALFPRSPAAYLPRGVLCVG